MVRPKLVEQNYARFKRTIVDMVFQKMGALFGWLPQSILESELLFLKLFRRGDFNLEYETNVNANLYDTIKLKLLVASKQEDLMLSVNVRIKEIK